MLSLEVHVEQRCSYRWISSCSTFPLSSREVFGSSARTGIRISSKPLVNLPNLNGTEWNKAWASRVGWLELDKLPPPLSSEWNGVLSGPGFAALRHPLHEVALQNGCRCFRISTVSMVFHFSFLLKSLNYCCLLIGLINCPRILFLTFKM